MKTKNVLAHQLILLTHALTHDLSQIEENQIRNYGPQNCLSQSY